MTIIPIQSEAHWHKIRQQYVGGSEVAALFGECSYLTRLELWLIKHGDVPGAIEENDRMFWGKLIEDAVGRGVALKKGWRVDNPHGYYVCDDTLGMGCTPDRIIFKTDNVPGLLQIKNVDRLEFLKWEDAQPPLAKQLQLQHELACAGYSWGAIGALIGGNDLKIYEYEAHAKTITKIKGAVGAFWQSVRDSVQPPAVADDYTILKDLYPGYNTSLIDLTADNELPSLCATALDAAERRKVAEKEEKQAKATILQKVGDHGRASCTGFEIKISQVNKGEYMVKAQSYKQLNIKMEKEK